MNIMVKKKDSKKATWIWPSGGNISPLLGSDGPFREGQDSSLLEDSRKTSNLSSANLFDGYSESPLSISEVGGSLSIFVARDPKAFFECPPEAYNYLNLDLEGNEWESLFYEVLGCPKGISELVSGEGRSEWQERYSLKFQRAIPDYPMLSRIWDLYIYVSYKPEEIEQLRDECLKVQASTSNEKALVGLEKLLKACNEASKINSGLLFVPD